MGKVRNLQMDTNSPELMTSKTTSAAADENQRNTVKRTGRLLVDNLDENLQHCLQLLPSYFDYIFFVVSIS